MEADIFLLYPNENEIEIVISEVKMPKGEGLNFNLIIGAFKQLVRDVKFLLALLPDISSEEFNIKTLAEFPDTYTNNLFCRDCSKLILSKEDFQLDSEHLKRKLSMKEPVLVEQNDDCFLTTVARMIGAEFEEFPQKAVNNFVVNYEETVDTLIFLDEKQQSILRTLDKNKEIKNFALQGSSGSGKTIIAIKIVNKLIERYLGLGHEKIFVYALAYHCKKHIGKINEMKLTTYFRNNINKQNSEKTICSYKMISEILEEVNIEWNTGHIQLLCEAIQKIHGRNPVIIFIDECERSPGDTLDDWRSLCPPGAPDPRAVLADNFHLILSFAPIQRFCNNGSLDDLSPTTAWFLVKVLDTRYRNSDKIQQLIRFLLLGNHGYLQIENEKSAPSVSGSVPVWIDVGDNHRLIPQSVETIRSQHFQQSDKHQQYLLHDEGLDAGILNDTMLCWVDSGTFLNWESFIGCEAMSVIFLTCGEISAGLPLHSAVAFLEPCSRAKLNLAIVTYRNEKLCFDYRFDYRPFMMKLM